MRMKTQDVADAWKAGKTAKNHGSNFHTDGENLYSYLLLIGITRNGKKVLFNYSKPNFISMTTSKHVGHGKSVAHKVVAPPD